jgi:hypothetical protein
MRISIPDVDLRGDKGSRSLDDENGNLVGQYLFGQHLGRTIVLLGKYRGDYKAQAECQAFADGVAAVLNHMTTMDPKGIIK